MGTYLNIHRCDCKPQLQAFVSWDKYEMDLLYPGEVVDLAATPSPLSGGCDDKLTTCRLVPWYPAELSAWFSWPALPGVGLGKEEEEPHSPALWWAEFTMTAIPALTAPRSIGVTALASLPTPTAQPLTGLRRWNPSSPTSPSCET